jgi:uncharacterized protein YjdB
MRGILSRALVLALTALAVGCSSTPTEPPPGDPGGSREPTPGPVQGFTIAPSDAILHAGGRLQLTATALRGGLESRVPSEAVSWSSSNEAVATVGPTGLVRTILPGQVEILALWQTNRATVRITVLKAVRDDDPSCRKLCL